MSVRKEFKYLGIVRANPAEYVARYGVSLLASAALPSIVNEFTVPNGLILAANYKYKELHELEGDISAMGLINLEAHGLGAYRAYLTGLGISFSSASQSFISSGSSSGPQASIEDVFASVDFDSNGQISSYEAEIIALRLNTLLGRNYGEDEVSQFISALDVNGDGRISLSEFKKYYAGL